MSAHPESLPKEDDSLLPLGQSLLKSKERVTRGRPTARESGWSAAGETLAKENPGKYTKAGAEKTLPASIKEKEKKEWQTRVTREKRPQSRRVYNGGLQPETLADGIL
eukprot:1140597-Pelagomonas_calceolata.AAC.5